MAPDRGEASRLSLETSGSQFYVDSADDEASSTTDPASSSLLPSPHSPSLSLQRSSSAREYLNIRATAPQNFTVRGLLVGIAVGIIICFSNMYFGLQTGWVSSMSMPASLMGFAFFKTISKHLDLPFTPVENVLIQTVAGAVGTMPLGSGFVGVIPAIEYLLQPGDDDKGGPLKLGWWRLVVWSLGLCFFGVVFAVPLRKEVIIREKLKFPSGTATALMIGVLHGEEVIRDGDSEISRSRKTDVVRPRRKRGRGRKVDAGEEADGLLAAGEVPREEGIHHQTIHDAVDQRESVSGLEKKDEWSSKIRLLILSFLVSGIYTLTSYFVPQLRHLPILGTTLAETWLWSLNPSPAYIGQGIIMGPATTLHMLLGALVGWGILSPLAKAKGWAPGPVKDWENGSKGWIVWISLAIMLADSIVSLGWLVLRPSIKYGRILGRRARTTLLPQLQAHVPLDTRHISSSTSSTKTHRSSSTTSSLPSLDAPSSELISTSTVTVLLTVSILVCMLSIHLTFPHLLSPLLLVLALLLALILSLMGVRALGETDLNPVSGISKLTQLIFALPMLTPLGAPNAVLMNLVAGAVSESGALQAGDMLQDLKTGHLLGASPKAQFWGQVIGSAVGGLASVVIYRLYTSVYDIPGTLFQIPTAYVWVFTARLVTGQGLPEGVWEFGVSAAALFALGTAVRVVGRGTSWQAWIPGGIAVAVGMYNLPSFTLARTIGGLLNWYWCRYAQKEETPIIVLASGLILGEGVMSIFNLVLASLRVPHL